MTLVEVVSAEGTGRSPMAAAIGKRYLSKQPSGFDLTIVASGINYATPIQDFLTAQRYIAETMRFGIQAGFEVYAPEEMKVCKDFLGPEQRRDHMQQLFTREPHYRKSMIDLAERGRTILQTMDTVYRDIALSRAGLRYDDPRQQTVKRSDAALVICVDPEVEHEAKRIYAGSIATIVTVKPVVDSCFASPDPGKYDTMRDALAQGMKNALWNFMRRRSGDRKFVLSTQVSE